MPPYQTYRSLADWLFDKVLCRRNGGPCQGEVTRSIGLSAIPEGRPKMHAFSSAPGLTSQPALPASCSLLPTRNLGRCGMT